MEMQLSAFNKDDVILYNYTGITLYDQGLGIHLVLNKYLIILILELQ